MPYADDSVFKLIERQYAKNVRKALKSSDERLRERLRKEFKVPPEFEDLALRIWWDGKED